MMNRLRFLTAGVLVAGLFSASGCILDGGGGPVDPGPLDTADIEIDVTFNGIADCQTAGVDTVVISFQGAALPSQTIPCDSPTGIAIDYGSVPSGDYTAVIEGQANGAPLYSGEGTFTVDPSGPTSFAFDLLPAQ